MTRAAATGLAVGPLGASVAHLGPGPDAIVVAVAACPTLALRLARVNRTAGSG